MHSSTELTIPKTKDSQEELSSHCAWHADAVVIPVGCDKGVWLPLPEGTAPQVSRTASLWPLAPVGFDAVGTTAGTEPQALS